MNIAASFPDPAETKASGADWLGAVPAGWRIKKMKFLFRDHSRKGMPDAELLSVTQDQGVVPRTWVENRMVMPSGSLGSFKFIEKGDFAISLRSFEGGLEYCHHDGIISPAYTVLKRRNDGVRPDYYRYLFKSAAFVSELQTSIVGIREGKNISFEELSHSLMPIPSADEQRAIAVLLDKKCAKIDEAVRIKEGQIKLLRERRQILIQQAVTRGLDPGVPMKDSGIDWIGQIPAHWEPWRNKFIFQLKKKLVGRRAPDYDLLSLTLRGIIKRDMENPEGKFPAEFDTYQEVNPGDFVFCHFDVEETPRTVGLSSYSGMITGAYTVYEPIGDINPRFLMHFYIFADTDKKMRGLYKGLRNTIPKDSFAAFKTPLPPRREQDVIVEYIDDQSRRIDDAISIKEDQITALKEYKTSLINAAVTGKIKLI